MHNTHAIVVNYPNQVGNCGRYELSDQRNYFSRFEGGSSHIFGLALQNCVSGDLITFTDQCSEIFDRYTQRRFDENTMGMCDYHREHREFNRRVFDIYRYAKSSLSVLGTHSGFSAVRKIAALPQFDSGSFLLK